jgi:hypothetical protein
VGAGLPIIGTLKHLLETGDKAQLVEGIFSGTLSYIFNTFGDGRPFSEIVKDAKAQVCEWVIGAALLAVYYVCFATGVQRRKSLPSQSRECVRFSSTCLVRAWPFLVCMA